jgi:tRNA nucleotidyltransferase (CCA-adding enzyme)
MMSTTSSALTEVVARIRGAGGRVWLVGGALRDELLGRPTGELDLATDLLPDRVLELFPGSLDVGARFGTVKVRLGEESFEVTTLRGEGAYSDGRRPDEVRFGLDIAEDLARRDFTVNALARELPEGDLIDPYGGLDDLRGGVLRAVGDPAERLAEDGLRAYRACRFAATLEFEVPPDLLEAVRRHAPVARGVAWERVGDELAKAMGAPRPGVCFELLRQTGLLDHCLPELAACYGVTQNRYHEFDVYDHSLLSCDLTPSEKPAVRWALLHDLGKPGTKRPKGRDFVFYGHDELSAELAEAALRRLKLPRALRERACLLIKNHMLHYAPEWSDAAVRRFVRRVGPENVADLFDLVIADRQAHRRTEGFQLPADISELLGRIEHLGAAGAPLTVADLAVSGDDLLKLTGRAPGRWVGELLDRLVEEVLEDPELNEREALLARAREMLADDR